MKRLCMILVKIYIYTLSLNCGRIFCYFERKMSKYVELSSTYPLNTLQDSKFKA